MIRLPSRRFHSYCVGTGKTGTHSIAGLFERNYRSAHEPECELLISVVLEHAEGRTTREHLRSLLRARDERLNLEMESDGTLFCFLDLLLEVFPAARFILTIRDCYTWLDSVFNHNLAKRIDGLWQKYDDYTFAPWNFQHTEQERVLADHGLLTLGHYLSHWTNHNQTVISTVPEERLLVVRTDRIRQSVPQIAAFLRIPAESLDLRQSHLFWNPRKFDILSQIERTFVEDSVRRYCSPLMERCFPEIRNYGCVC